MSELSPREIRQVRLGLGWSAREMGEFFNRTGATIYHWENGKTAPGPNVAALIKRLREELEWREDNESQADLCEWIEHLREHGVDALVQAIPTHVSLAGAGSYCRHLVQLANRHGGITIRSSSGKIMAYVVPNKAPDLLNWTRNLPEITLGDE